MRLHTPCARAHILSLSLSLPLSFSLSLFHTHTHRFVAQIEQEMRTRQQAEQGCRGGIVGRERGGGVWRYGSARESETERGVGVSIWGSERGAHFIKHGPTGRRLGKGSRERGERRRDGR
jgi:hypothetical protein